MVMGDSDFVVRLCSGFTLFIATSVCVVFQIADVKRNIYGCCVMACNLCFVAAGKVVTMNLSATLQLDAT